MKFWHLLVKKPYFSRTISAHFRQFPKRFVTISWPSWVAFSFVAAVLSRFLRSISFSCSWNPLTSEAGNLGYILVTFHPTSKGESETFCLVFAAEMERRIDMSLSCVVTSSGERSESEDCKSPRTTRQEINLFCNKVNRWGEWLCSPLRRVSCMALKVWLADSRSFVQ